MVERSGKALCLVQMESPTKNTKVSPPSCLSALTIACILSTTGDSGSVPRITTCSGVVASASVTSRGGGVITSASVTTRGSGVVGSCTTPTPTPTRTTCGRGKLQEAILNKWIMYIHNDARRYNHPASRVGRLEQELADGWLPY